MENILQKQINIEQTNEIENSQNNFLETTIGKIINSGIDIGIRTLLPDFLEEQVIELKNNLIKYGLLDGISKTIQDTIEYGKSAIGIVTGKFDNIYQMQEAIKSGGIIDNVSNLVDSILNLTYSKGKINYNVLQTIKQGKNTILNYVEKNIENNFTAQIKSLNYTNKYIDNWKKYYNNKNFEGMEKEYIKIKKEIKNIVPIENNIKEIRKIENIHELIKNNGQNFDLSNEEKALAEKL